MPIYEYKCKGCGRRFELMRSMRDGHAPASCPACGSPDTSRLLSVFAAQTGGGESDNGACGWDAAAGACFRGG